MIINNDNIKFFVGKIKPRQKYFINVIADGTFTYQFVLKTQTGKKILGVLRDSSNTNSFSFVSSYEGEADLYIANFPGGAWTRAEINLEEDTNHAR